MKQQLSNLAAATLALCAAAAVTQAQAYPSKPVTIGAAFRGRAGG